MSYILNIETSSNRCSISISFKEKSIYFEQKEGFSHAEMLAPMVQKAIKQTNITLDAIAISQGPGSYTGLRIGTSFAKGLCYSLNIPLLAVNTLKLIAKIGLSKSDKNIELIIPMIDARRNEVYLQTFSKDLKNKNTSSNLILESASLKETPNVSTLIIGSGSIKAEQIITKKPNLKFIHGINPSAEFMPELSFAKFKSKQFEDVAYFEPYYLKPFFTNQKKKS